SIIVLVGTILSNIPQQYRIARRRSAEGVSSYFLMTGLASATCALVNIVGLSLYIFDCCISGGLSSYQCSVATMGIAVTCTQWLVMAVIVLIWSIVLPGTKWEYPDSPHDTLANMVWVNLICFVHLVLTFGVFGILYVYAPDRQIDYANAQGIISAVIAALQYAPQIWTTWKLKHTGSISIPWLIVQTPGGLAAMTALIGRPGTNWTTWLASIGTFIGQFLLLILCCHWAWKDRKHSVREQAEAG
ncbi:hypothetical protein GQ53DRAFT_608352, partial [Thozetella sp. PMI_491]